MNKFRNTRVIGISTIALLAVLVVFTWSAPSNAATPPSEGFADLVEQVEPSVVTIEVSKSASAQPSQFDGDPRSEEFMRRFFGGNGTKPTQQQPMRGAGSGFIIDSDGYIVTNNHVIEGADEITVRLLDGRQFTATMVGADDKTDLALLKIDADDLEVAEFGDSDATRVGEWVVAIGNPFGLGGTATAGIVSARSRDIRSGPYDDFLQIDAPINRGNSGGPVFNTDGEVVGVNTMIYSPNGGSVGIGFAIPSNQVNNIIAELRSDGVVDRGWLGVSLQDLDEDLANGLGLDSNDGALVAEVVRDSPAEKAGIQAGDVIIEYNGNAISNGKDLSKLVGAADSGDEATIRAWRGDKKIKLTAVLGIPEGDVVASKSAQNLDDLGLAIAPLTDELRAQLKLDDHAQGAVVTKVVPGSSADEQGIQRGDLLVQADRQPIASAEDLRDVMAAAKKSARDSVPVLVNRNGSQRFAVLPVV